MTTNDLTPAQHAILVAVERWFQDHDYAPSVRDISRATGRTHSTVHVHFATLEEKGYIQREPLITRSLRLVK